MRERVADSHDTAVTLLLLRGACHRAARRLLSGAPSRDPVAPTRWLAMTLVERVEMMDWSMAVTDAQAIGRGNRRRHPGLGVADRGLQIVAFGKSRRDRRRQRASGAVCVSGGDPRSRQRNGAGLAEKIIDALLAFPVAALDQHRASAHRQQTFALTLDPGFA